MAFSAFPSSYQPMGYQQNYMQPQPAQMPQQMTQPQPAAQPVQNNPMIWVQGETGAKSYLLAPNTTLPLWDSEKQTIYLKSTDASGMPSMKVLDYTIRDTNKPVQPVPGINPQSVTDYVTKAELQEFENKIIKKFEKFTEETGA